MRRADEIKTKKDILSLRTSLHPNAGGQVIGVIDDSIRQQARKKFNLAVQFIHTYAYSCSVSILKDGRYAIGYANIAQAGRGIVLTKEQLISLLK